MMEQEALIALDYQALGTFVVYIVLMLLVGVIASRFSSEGINNFFIGGRKMSGLIVAMSAVVSGRSAWLLLGFTGMAWHMGLAAMWAAVGYISVELLLFLFYASRLRRFSGRYDCITLPDFFAERFHDPKGYLRLVVVVIILIFMVAYVSAQFVAGGKAFSASFGLDYTWGLIITTAIILIYVILGGFLAVSLSDTIQAFIILLAMLVLPVKAIADMGGWHSFVAVLRGIDGGALFDPMALSAGAMIGFLGIGLGSPGNPHIVARYMSLRSGASFRRVALMGTIANVLMALGALFIGLTGRAFFPEVAALPAGDVENLYPILAWQHLHPIMFGLVVASIFSAIMSTADSQLLVAASSVVRDIYEKIIMRGAPVPQKTLVWLSRVVIAIIVVLSVILGWVAGNLVFWLVLFAWAGLGAALGPTTILALFWRRTSRSGVMAGAITGAVTVIVWNQIPYLKAIVYELVPAFAIATLVTIVVSLIAPSEKKESADEMFRCMKYGHGDQQAQ